MQYLALIVAALIGVLVPACAKWLWGKIEQPLNRIDARMDEFETGHKEHEARLNAHDVEIAYLRGVQAERQQTAVTMAAASQIAAAVPFQDTDSKGGASQ